MPTIKRFEELRIWQEARKQCQQINALIRSTSLKDDYTLRNQLERSSGSVMDNIAEGFDRFSKNDFRHFLIIARGSNAEVRSQLYRASDKGYITEEAAQHAIKFAEILSVSITNFISYLDNSGYKTKPSGTNYVREFDINYLENFELNIPEDLN